jgi:hypothetical protein
MFIIERLVGGRKGRGRGREKPGISAEKGPRRAQRGRMVMIVIDIIVRGLLAGKAKERVG